MSTIFSSGSFVLKGTTLCAVVAGDKQACCAPDIPSGDVSVELNAIEFQGGIEAADRIDVSTSSSTPGPLIAHKLTVAQSLTTYLFPNLTTVPVATPGGQVVLATPQRPANYSG